MGAGAPESTTVRCSVGLEAEGFSRLATEIAQALAQYDPALATGTDDLEEVEWLSLAEKRFEQGLVNEDKEEKP